MFELDRADHIAEELREHTDGLPFAVVADPGKRLYREFGVEQARRALLSPRAWGPAGAARGLPDRRGRPRHRRQARRARL
nr:hypothetical protein [Streptomyces sp. NEAU-383]